MAMAMMPAVGSQYHDDAWTWNLPNGEVRFERPLRFPGVTMREEDGELESSSSDSSSSPSLSSSVSLWDPVFLGSGGSGAVFSFSTHQNNKDRSTPPPTQDDDHNHHDVAVKVSWVRSRESVENECSILQTLEGGNVQHVERCLGLAPYHPGSDGGGGGGRRVMIALTPVVATPTSSNGGIITSSLIKVDPGRPREYATRGVVEAMTGMLRVGVYTVDVQPLVVAGTGEVLFVDFTEARRYSNPPTPADMSGLVGFVSEMGALVPDSMRDAAARYLMSELNASRDDGDAARALPEKVVDILESAWLD